MKILLLPLFLAAGFSASSQYYYNEIVGTRETNRLMQQLVALKVKTVSATGYDENGTRSTDFSEFQEVKENGHALKVTNITNRSRSVMYSSYDDQARVMSITDSLAAVDNNTTYEYDKEGRLAKVQNNVKDESADFSQVEIHAWTYDNAGRPTQMLRIISNSGAMAGTDTVVVKFTLDEKGNVAEERTYHRGVEGAFYYYYYDEKNRLTDIVTYNNKIRKLVPEVIFTYDDQDRVIQKVTSTPGEILGKVTWVGYTTWRYAYDGRGLKVREALFDKSKQPAGKIDYSYTVGQ